MSDQFKRMQVIAGLITEGEAAYEYEKGKEAGEKAEKKKMKKSELKKQIKEMILAEINIDLSNDDNFYDPVAEAKKKKKDEEETETEEVTIDDTEMDMGGEMDMGAEASVPAASDVQKELMDALEAAKASGDEKLVRQIGNALTYFTRSQVSKEEVPSMNEVLSPEYIDRMEGLANMQDLAVLKAKLRMLSSDWMQEGFEKEDIVEYTSELINQI